MTEPQTTPREHDKPIFQPGNPTPEDPRQNEPIQDPPVDPEHDEIERINPVRQAGDVERGIDERGTSGIETVNDSPVVFDENRAVG
jgi:hypothetical protein